MSLELAEFVFSGGKRERAGCAVTFLGFAVGQDKRERGGAVPGNREQAALDRAALAAGGHDRQRLRAVAFGQARRLPARRKARPSRPPRRAPRGSHSRSIREDGDWRRGVNRADRSERRPECGRAAPARRAASRRLAHPRQARSARRSAPGGAAMCFRRLGWICRLLQRLRAGRVHGGLLLSPQAARQLLRQFAERPAFHRAEAWRLRFGGHSRTKRHDVGGGGRGAMAAAGVAVASAAERWW